MDIEKAKVLLLSGVVFDSQLLVMDSFLSRFSYPFRRFATKPCGDHVRERSPFLAFVGFGKGDDVSDRNGESFVYACIGSLAVPNAGSVVLNEFNTFLF